MQAGVGAKHAWIRLILYQASFAPHARTSSVLERWKDARPLPGDPTPLGCLSMPTLQRLSALLPREPLRCWVRLACEFPEDIAQAFSGTSSSRLEALFRWVTEQRFFIPWDEDLAMSLLHILSRKKLHPWSSKMASALLCHSRPEPTNAVIVAAVQSHALASGLQPLWQSWLAIPRFRDRVANSDEALPGIVRHATLAWFRLVVHDVVHTVFRDPLLRKQNTISFLCQCLRQAVLHDRPEIYDVVRKRCRRFFTQSSQLRIALNVNEPRLLGLAILHNSANSLEHIARNWRSLRPDVLSKAFQCMRNDRLLLPRTQDVLVRILPSQVLFANWMKIARQPLIGACVSLLRFLHEKSGLSSVSAETWLSLWQYEMGDRVRFDELDVVLGVEVKAITGGGVIRVLDFLFREMMRGDAGRLQDSVDALVNVALQMPVPSVRAEVWDYLLESGPFARALAPAFACKKVISHSKFPEFARVAEEATTRVLARLGRSGCRLCTDLLFLTENRWPWSKHSVDAHTLAKLDAVLRFSNVRLERWPWQEDAEIPSLESFDAQSKFESQFARHSPKMFSAITGWKDRMSRGEWNLSLLFCFACWNGQLSVVRKFLAGPSVFVLDMMEGLPLRLASSTVRGRRHALPLLLRAGANPLYANAEALRNVVRAKDPDAIVGVVSAIDQWWKTVGKRRLATVVAKHGTASTRNPIAEQWLLTSHDTP